MYMPEKTRAAGMKILRKGMYIVSVKMLYEFRSQRPLKIVFCFLFQKFFLWLKALKFLLWLFHSFPWAMTRLKKKGFLKESFLPHLITHFFIHSYVHVHLYFTHFKVNQRSNKSKNSIFMCLI